MSIFGSGSGLEKTLSLEKLELLEEDHRITRRNLQYLHKRFMMLGGAAGKGHIDVKKQPPMLTGAPSCDNIFAAGFKMSRGKVSFSNFLNSFQKFVAYNGKWKSNKPRNSKEVTLKDKLEWTFKVICDMAGCPDEKLTAVHLKALFQDFLPTKFIELHKAKLPIAAKQVIKSLAGDKAHYISKKQYLDHVMKEFGGAEPILNVQLDSISTPATL